MIRCGFLSEEDRKALIALARDGLAAGRVTRRATALVRLDEGLSCQEVAKVLLFDDDTIRGWYELFEQEGVEGLSRFEMGGSAGKMSAEQCDALKAWVGSGLLGADETQARDRADERARSHQHSRRDRSGERPNPYDRSRIDRREVDDPAARSAGSAVSLHGLHPRIPGQRELSPCQARQGMAVPARAPDQAAFPAGLLPASESDRATLGGDAQEHHAQQMLRDLRRIRPSDPGFPAQRGPQEVGRNMRFGHRQFPYNLT